MAEVEVQQCTELTVTNRSRAYPERLFKGFGSSVCGFEGIEMKIRTMVLVFFVFARHGRALTGASPEHAQIVGSV